MRKFSLLFFTTPFLFLISTAVLFYSGCQGKRNGNVIAIINGREVSVDLLEAYFLENLNGDFNGSASAGIDQTEEEINKVKSRLLEDFIDTQLVVEQAEKAGISISDEDALRFLQELGESEKSVAETDQRKVDWIKDLMVIQKFKNETLFSDIVVSEEEVRQYFQKQIKGKSEHEKFFLEIIVFESEKEAQNILKKLRANKERYENLKEKYAMLPGETDPQPYFLDELPETIREEVRKMKKGDISKVLPLLKRFCIIKLEGIEKAGTGPLERISGDLREKITMEKEERIFQEYLHKLRKNSEVKIFYKRLPFDFIADRSDD